MCGTNNCKPFGDFFHAKDDCCVQPNEQVITSHVLRCGGRNIDKEKCCTKEAPCSEGEGDCENNDECSRDLECGNNNCKQFGDFFHEKDDCCVGINTSKNIIIEKDE